MVYPTIRNKLGAALAAWHPADRSAKLILLPWAEVFRYCNLLFCTVLYCTVLYCTVLFSRAAMLAFLTKNICPKLESALASLVISPRAQVSCDWSPGHRAHLSLVRTWRRGPP